jgi:hypothetical protein
MNKPRSPTQIRLETKSTGDKTIDRLVQDYVQNVVAGFGGWSEVMPGEMFMLLSQKISLEIILKCQAELSKQEAMLDAKGKPSPLVWEMARFQAEFRAGQISLGLARPRITTRRPIDLKAQPRDSIAAIVEEYRDEKKSKLKVV